MAGEVRRRMQRGRMEALVFLPNACHERTEGLGLHWGDEIAVENWSRGRDVDLTTMFVVLR